MSVARASLFEVRGVRFTHSPYWHTSVTLRKPRFQSRTAVSAGHTSYWISVLSVLPHKGTEGQVRNSRCKHEQGQNKTTHNEETQGHIWERGNEWQVGRVSSWSMHTCCMIGTDCPDHELPNMTGQQGEPRRYPKQWQYPPPQGRLLQNPRRTHHGGTDHWEQGPECRELESSISPPDHNPPSQPGIDQWAATQDRLATPSMSLGGRGAEISGWRGSKSLDLRNLENRVDFIKLWG